MLRWVGSRTTSCIAQCDVVEQEVACGWWTGHTLVLLAGADCSRIAPPVMPIHWTWNMMGV